MNSSDICHLLQGRYDPSQWALFFEVPDSTGGHHRRADAMAFNLWPSRGLETIGFEIKVYRSDWLNELKTQKSENLQKFCDQWYIVAPPGIVKPEEMPKTWGLLETTPGEIRQKIKAPKLKSTAFDDKFTMSLLRCATKPPEWYKKEIEKLNDENYEQLKKERQEQSASYDVRLKKETEWMSEFKEKVGINIGGYNRDQVLAFFEMFNDKNKVDRFIENMEYDRQRLTELMKAFNVLFSPKVEVPVKK